MGGEAVTGKRAIPLLLAAAASLALVLAPGVALAGSGSLGLLEAHVDGVGGVGGLNNATGVAVTPDGNHVYVAACGDSAVAAFARSSATGKLSFVEAKSAGPGCYSDVAVSPDGKHVYVVNFDGGSVLVFARDGGSGSLTLVEEETAADFPPGEDPENPVFFDGPQSVAVSPDGRHVYVGGARSEFDDGVWTFSRDSTTGRLAVVEVDKVSEMATAVAVAVSPGGESVYVAGSAAIDTFARDPGTGALSPLDSDALGDEDIQGVAAAGDGRNVYVTGNSESGSSVAAFTRDLSTGGLGFLEFERDGVGGVSGLGGAQGIALSPEGGNVYAVGFGDDSVVTFTRGADGRLGFAEVDARGDGTSAIDGPWDIAVSPDGDNAYVAALAADAVLTFARGARPLSLEAEAKKKQKASRLKAKVTCSLACKLKAKAKAKVGRDTFKSKKVKEELAGGDPSKIGFELKGRGRLLKLLRDGKGIAKISVAALSGREEDRSTVKVKLKP